MIRRHTANVLTASFLCAFCLVSVAIDAADWPGFLGPQRNGCSSETGLLKEWPESGPSLAWKTDTIGEGWSSMAVVDGRIYTTGNSGDSQMLICLKLDGTDVWRVKQGPKCDHKKYGGARSTPTIDGDRLYVTGGNGLVTCHRLSDGSIVWKRDMKTEMEGQIGGWKYAESVLILDQFAIVTPGGKNAIVALDKLTGKDVWKSNLSARAGYSSCRAITQDGHTIIANGSQDGLLIVDAQTGERIHKHEFAVRNTANVPTPIYVDGLLFWAVGYNKGALCLKVKHTSDGWSFDEAWRNKDLNCHPGNYVIAEGFVYGKGKRGLVCVDLQTGETQWMDRVGAGEEIWADGMLYVFSDSDGRLSLVDPVANEDRVKGSFQVEGAGRSWSLPVVADGRLLVRYDTNLYCFNIKSR